jgi:hypothetical protein
VKVITLPQPPSATDPNFNQAAVSWMSQVKSAIEGASRVNDTPMGQQFQVGSFTTNTAIAGTSTGTDIANFLASFVSAMTSKGLVSPTIKRGDV